MKLISHRGNINGKQPTLENSPNYILNAIEHGYDVEIDVWYDKGWWLGHDAPEYKIEEIFLTANASRLWCHAKNGEALVEMKKTDPWYKKGLHYFWHQEDDFTLTSKGFIWTFPKKMLYYNSICVLPERGYTGDLNACYGICSDYIKDYE